MLLGHIPEITRGSVLSLLPFFLFSCLAHPDTLDLAAGETDIPAGIAFVEIPGEFQGDSLFTLISLKGGEALPAQRWDEETAAFVLPEALPAGEEMQFVMDRAAESPKGSVQVVERQGQIEVTGAQGPILTYHIRTEMPPEGAPEYYRRSGFIHPVFSPSGKVLTDDFPQGHTHQHALFMAWVNTTFHGDKVDFWNQQDGSGTVEHRRVLDIEQGPVFGRFRVEHAYVSTKHGDALKEIWTVTVYPMGTYILFDIRSDQRCATEELLHLNEYHYGGMAFRGSAQWNAVDEDHFEASMRVLTSEGLTDVQAANHTRPRWTAGFGPVDEELAGLAILDHPDNFRHPQPVRVHPDMPYFCLTPMVEGAFDIVPGETYRSSYRFVSFDGEADPGQLEALWQAFAHPPLATNTH